MSATRVNIGEDKKSIAITAPKVTNNTFRLLIPELHGKDEHAPFAVQEVLDLTEAEKDAKLKFSLAGNAEELGVVGRHVLHIFSNAIQDTDFFFKYVAKKTGLIVMDLCRSRRFCFKLFSSANELLGTLFIKIAFGRHAT